MALPPTDSYGEIRFTAGIITARPVMHGGCSVFLTASDLYDVVRIDHFRGFDEYFSIPYGDKDARNGHWEKGPGIDLFHRNGRSSRMERDVIAEDLGYM